MANPLDQFRQLRPPSAHMTRHRILAIALILTLAASMFSPSQVNKTLALDVPSQVTPANGSTITAASEAGAIQAPPSAVPEFSWTGVGDAIQYRVQLSQDIGFNTVYEFNTPHTRYTPINIGYLADGLWYWRVRVEAPVVGNYSPISSFTKQWASPHNLPILTMPLPDATLQFYDSPAFSWQPVIGAATYRMQISTAPEFAVLLYNQNTIATTNQPTTKLPNGTYYWRVIPIDPVGRTGTASAIRRFDLAYNQVPILLAPENNSFPTFTPTFHWTAVRGATFYRLEYSTDPTFNVAVTRIDTRNTTYTPRDTLPNDINIYWRVRTHSGESISNWSPTWTFLKQWYIQPQLLTPVNTYPLARFPFFSWTPVPGANYYRIEVDYDIDFINPYLSETTSNPFYMPRYYEGAPRINYWRVIPYDHNNNQGLPSVPSSYLSSGYYNAPQQVYPLYYYPPNSFPPPDATVAMNPYEDRTVPLPEFIWQRVTMPPLEGGLFAQYYTLEVDDDPLFLSVDWSAVTENTMATPTAANPFTPQPGVDYYWRVCPSDMAGNCFMTDPPDPMPWMSQHWRTRIDTTLMPAPTTDPAPQLIRPVRNTEYVEGMPLFEWWPKSGADSYEIQISIEPTFASPVDSDVVPYPAYAPTEMLAQRDILNRLNYGTYYWRVRALSGGIPLGSWSDVWRFQVASQSAWLRTRTIGDAGNRLQIASDPDDTADANFELTDLQAAQDIDKWYFGFSASTAATNMTYALYIDMDHVDNSGCNAEPRNYTISTIPAHKPEYVIYIFQIGSAFSAAQTAVYACNGLTWNSPQALSTMAGGGLSYSGGYLEIRVPNTAIGMDLTTGSYALSLVSLPAAAPGSPVDSVPSDPNVPGSGQLSRFASVSARMTPLTPPSNLENDPTAYPSIPPFFWEYPSGSYGTAPWAGAKMEVKLDPQFTSGAVANFDLDSNAPYYAPTAHAWPYDFIGNNTYYWRIQPRYLDAIGAVFGPWSQGMRFEREGFMPQNLSESVTFSTPTFSWDMVEGADSYELQVDNDPGFGSPEINEYSAQNSFTSSSTLSNAIYYWRVRIRRYNGVANEWSSPKSFTLQLPVPQGLTPNDPTEQNVIGKSPTLCWDALIVSDDQQVPVLAANRYRVQVSRGDPTFSQIYDSTETEQTCWTPTKGYDDGKYYWQVAMIDGQGRQSDYSPTAEFTKQYPRAVPQYPVTGSTTASTPTFTWTAVDGVTPYVNGAASYKLEISQFPTFSPTYEVVVTQNTRYTPPAIYQPNKTYYWRVAIIDADGRLGPFSDATIILRNSLYLPILMSH